MNKITGIEALDDKLCNSTYWDWIDVSNTYPYLLGVDFSKEVDSCLHKNCPECHGSGVKLNGEICIHMISCPCPRCTPRC